jgi:hypothetical protein
MGRKPGTKNKSRMPNVPEVKKAAPIVRQLPSEIISNLVLKGDLSGLTQEQKVLYYNEFCRHLGLDPLTQPFKILRLSGKEVLYADKGGTDQLRKQQGVSITSISGQLVGDIYIVTAIGQNAEGRSDGATGAVNITGKKGDDLANAYMKAETKAKRRLTLSLCGLGMLDESEIDSIPGAATMSLSMTQDDNSTNGSPRVSPNEPKGPPNLDVMRIDGNSTLRLETEKEIGRLAATLGGDQVEAARNQLSAWRADVETKKITMQDYDFKIKLFQKDLDARVADKGLF